MFKIVPCRRVGRASQCRVFVVVGAGGSAVQGKAARMACQAVVIAAAHRQVASMRSRSWRALRVMRAAHVQHPVAEGVDFAAGDLGVAGESDEFGPGDEIGCGHDDFEPGRVGVEVVAGQVGQSGGLGLRGCGPRRGRVDGGAARGRPAAQRSNRGRCR